MAYARYQFTVTDAAGNVVPEAQIAVRAETAGKPLVQLYADRDGNVPLGNPFAAGADGFAAFHVEGGAYEITASAIIDGEPFERTWSFVPIGTAQEFDFGDPSGILSFDWDAVIPVKPASLGSNLRLDGTAFGDLAANGGLNAAFNDAANQAQSACAAKAGATSAYIGRSFDAGRRIHTVSVYGSNNQGYVDGADPSVTLTLYGKTGAPPANATDGTVLGSLVFTDTANESAARNIVSSDQGTKFDHVWVRIAHNGSPATIAVAELQIFEAIGGLSAYDGEDKGFSVLVEADVDHANLPAVYYKLSNAQADWSNGFVFPAIRLKAAFVMVIDAGDSVIATGPSHSYPVPFPGVITGWSMLAGGVGSIELDIWKSTYASYPPAAANSIVGGNYPAIVAASKNQDNALSGWNKTIAEGDVLRLNVRSCSGLTKVTLTLYVQRT